MHSSIAIGILENEASQSFQRWLLEIDIILIILTRWTGSRALTSICAFKAHLPKIQVRLTAKGPLIGCSRDFLPEL